MATRTQPGGRLDYIDGLRGIAAFLVVFQHAAQLTHDAGSNLFDPSLYSINFGRFGVGLFFLISGFVIPFSFRGTQPLRRFWLGRFFRLYPAYWVSVAVMILLPNIHGNSLDAMTVLFNLTMVQNLFGFENLGYGYWTLNFEMYFYMICTVLFAVGLLRSVSVNVAIVAAGLFMTGGTHLRHYLGLGGGGFDFPYFVAIFFLGMLMRRAFIEGERSAIVACWLLVPATVLVGATMGGLMFPVGMNESSFFKPVPYSLAMMLPPLVLVGVLWLRPATPRVVGWLGMISYSLYLFQDIWLIMLPFLIAPASNPLAFVLLCCGLSVVVAAIAYYAVERPMLRIGHRLANRPRRVGAGAEIATG